MKPNELHELVHLPFIIKPEEINKRIAQFRVLLDKASVSDVTRQNESGETILHLMAVTPALVELAKEVIKKYPQLVSIRNNVGIYPIHTAILNENRELLEFLLSIDGPRTDTRGRSIIHHAVDASPEILELCCNAAPELIGETDGDGYTALERARDSGDTAAQQLLSSKIRLSPEKRT